MIEAARQGKLKRTTDVARLLIAAAGGEKKRWRLHPRRPASGTCTPAARTFQVLRILVNRELANLEHLLRVLPGVLRPGGRAAIISFHSGEDRLVKTAFRVGRAAGVYDEITAEPIRPSFAERHRQPAVAGSAKLRWARARAAGFMPAVELDRAGINPAARRGRRSFRPLQHVNGAVLHVGVLVPGEYPGEALQPGVVEPDHVATRLVQAHTSKPLPVLLAAVPLHDLHPRGRRATPPIASRNRPCDAPRS